VSHHRGAVQPTNFKNTGDLQGENPQKYNIGPCNREKKGDRHETIKNNEKNRRKQSKNNAPGDRAPRGNKKTADELRRRLSH
jgi:hypothetical protein